MQISLERYIICTIIQLIWLHAVSFALQERSSLAEHMQVNDIALFVAAAKPQRVTQI